jgi:ACS family hexuronate transporter-like MFS transporter
MRSNSLHISWVILLFLFVATALSFLDRQVLSMTIIRIQAEFHVTDVQYGFVNTCFLISYALMFTIGGRLMDLLGSKLGLLISLGIWSLAIGLHGIMNNYYQLLILRFMLGVGEGGCFPGAIKAVYDWFDVKKRAFANGVAIGGSAIGAVIAPPITIFISGRYGWRWSFVVPFLIGLVWLVGWVLIPWGEKSRRSARVKAEKPVVIPILTLLKNKEARVFMLLRFLLDPVVYFIMFWTPKYLHEQRGISFDGIGNLFWIPFMALGVSNIAGGWLSDKLVAGGFSVNRSRKTIMGCAALLTAVAPLITSVGSAQLAVALMAVVMFAHGFWITNYITSISDVFGASGTATVVGLSGTAGGISALLINPLIGVIVHKYSYTPIWIVSGMLYPLAFALFMIFIPRIRPMTASFG